MLIRFYCDTYSQILEEGKKRKQVIGARPGKLLSTLWLDLNLKALLNLSFLAGQNQLPGAHQDSSKLVLSVTAQLLCDSGLIFWKTPEVLQTLLCCQAWARVWPSPLPVVLGG